MYKEYRTSQSKEAKCGILREKTPEQSITKSGSGKVYFVMHFALSKSTGLLFKMDDRRRHDRLCFVAVHQGHHDDPYLLFLYFLQRHSNDR